MAYYLAVDIGASSGRCILGYIDHGKMQMKEIHRFENGLVLKQGHLCWDMNHLLDEILTGMKRCKELGMIPASVGIDTWGVDFILLDSKGQPIGDCVGYRDSRTDKADQAVYQKVHKQLLYERTGIQKQKFNTVFQLMALQQQSPEQLKQAKTFLMVPDYFNYRLCGTACCEYTNASTTSLVNAKTHDWDWELIEKLGYPTGIFPKILAPGTKLGHLTSQIQEIVGFNCEVVLPATHDTGSAVIAVPSNHQLYTGAQEKNGLHQVQSEKTRLHQIQSAGIGTSGISPLYISSGTWSLMGTELEQADCSEASMNYNFTNEGGYDFRIRYLKNIMGLWMVQCLKKESPEITSFAQLCREAAKAKISSMVDCDDQRFLAPRSMKAEIAKSCLETNQQVPENAAEYAKVIYQSLAACYAKTLLQIEQQTGRTYQELHIIGGGSNADYLNQLTADATHRVVIAGPQEATAIGNLAVQMITGKEYDDISQAKESIGASFGVKRFEPMKSEADYK